MTVLTWLPWTRRFNRRRLRRAFRGYRRLKATNELGRIAALKSSLTTKRLDICDRRTSPLVFGAALAEAELVVRQYLLHRIGGTGLNSAVLRSIGRPGGKVVYPLPREWREVLREHRFDVAERRSAWLFAGFLGLHFVYGLVTLGRHVVSNVFAVRNPRERLGRFVYFHGMTARTLPQPGPDGRSHDFLTWYARWDGRVADVDALCHSVPGARRHITEGIPVVPVPSAMLPLIGIAPNVRLLGTITQAAALAARDLTRGRWWHALMLNEAVPTTQLRHQRADRVAREFLFHNSGWIYRPLWTYEAKARGSQVTFYFYSTNVEGFQPAIGRAEPGYGWRSANWPRYLVWDDCLADFVKRAIDPDAAIHVVGPIWFSTSAEAVAPFTGRTVAVFDVAPFRSARYIELGLEREYYVADCCVPFLEHARKAAGEAGCTMVWKRKREIGKLADVRYRRFAEQLESADDVASINPGISAVRVIEACDMVVSMPFTSTALIAKHLRKPSCYYDPRALLRPDDPAAHGIPIVQGPEALAAWVAHNAQDRA